MERTSWALNKLGHEGLLKRIIGGHWGLIPKLQKLVFENKVEGYNLPFGTISLMFRDIAGHRPGTFTKIGLKDVRRSSYRRGEDE